MKRFTSFLESFDISGGALLGLHTLIMLILAITAFIQRREMPTTVVGFYTANLTAYAVTKTYRITKQRR